MQGVEHTLHGSTDGVTITGGYAIDSFGSPPKFGGGMYNTNSSPTLTHVTFSGNTSDAFGGGMSDIDSSPVLTHVTFNGNSTEFNLGIRETLTR